MAPQGSYSDRPLAANERDDLPIPGSLRQPRVVGISPPRPPAVLANHTQAHDRLIGMAEVGHRNEIALAVSPHMTGKIVSPVSLRAPGGCARHTPPSRTDRQNSRRFAQIRGQQTLRRFAVKMLLVDQPPSFPDLWQQLPAIDVITEVHRVLAASHHQDVHGVWRY